MRFSRTLSISIAREIVAYSALGFVAITTIFAGQNLLRRFDALLMLGFGQHDFVALLRALFPMVASYTLPIALLLGTLLAMRRMSADLETLAMSSCGLGPPSLLVPALTLAVLASLLSAYLLLSVEHRARREILSLFKAVAARGGVLEPGRITLRGGRAFYVDGRDREGRLEGIAIFDDSDPRRPLRIFAERGQLRFDADSSELQIALEKGEVHLSPPTQHPDRYRRFSFDHLVYALDASGMLGESISPVRPKQMTLGELRGVVERATNGDALLGLDQRNPIEYAVEIHRRFALPFTPVLFALLAVPMGLRVSRSGRAWGMLQCILIVFVFYGLQSFGQLLARTGSLAPMLALWLPNLLFAVSAAALLVRRGFRVAA